MFGNRKLLSSQENKGYILSKSPLKSRPQIPFTRNNQLLPDKQKIPTPVRKGDVARPVTAKIPYITNVKVEYPSSSKETNVNPAPVPPNEQNIVRLKISEENASSGKGTTLNSDVVIHKSPNWSGPGSTAETDDRDEKAKSVYNDVIRALKKTRSPMHAELRDQSTPLENTQSIYGAKETKVVPKIQRQGSKPKKGRPDRVSEGNTPADVRQALAALNTVINDEIEKAESGMVLVFL